MEDIYEKQTFAIVSIGIFCVSFSNHPPPPAYCEIVPIVPEKVVKVIVTLEANPTSGAAPLSVKFTSTAKAKIHYEDEYDDGTEGGSFEPEPDHHYKYKDVTPKKPPDQIIKEPGVHNFTATAEYGGVKGEATVTVVATAKCYDEWVAWQLAANKVLPAFEKKEKLDQEAEILLLLTPIICYKDPSSCKDAIDNLNKKIDAVIKAKKDYEDARDKANELYKIWQDCLKGK